MLSEMANGEGRVLLEVGVDSWRCLYKRVNSMYKRDVEGY